MMNTGTSVLVTFDLYEGEDYKLAHSTLAMMGFRAESPEKKLALPETTVTANMLGPPKSICDEILTQLRSAGVRVKRLAVAQGVIYFHDDEK